MLLNTFIRRLPSFANHRRGAFDLRQVPGYGAAVALIAVATVARWFLEGILPPGFPFLTYFPAVVLVSFTFGVWPGTLAGTLGLVASWYFFIPPPFSFAMDQSTLVALAFYVFVVAVDILLMNIALNATFQLAVAAAKNEELTAYQGVLIRELDHRILNLFSVVTAIIKLSARETSSAAELASLASDRVLALSRSHSRIWQTESSPSVTVQQIAEDILAPYLKDAAALFDIRAQVRVADIRHVQIICLIMHELATNSAKYGSLREMSGRITIVAEDGGAAAPGLTITWNEASGSIMPQKEGRNGFGSEMIARLVKGTGGRFERRLGEGEMQATASLPYANG